MLYLPYVITEAFLTIYSIVLLTSIHINLGSEVEVRKFKRIIYTFLITLVMDIFWGLVEGNFIEPSPVLNATLNGISISAVAVGCYFWYKFIAYRLQVKLFNRKWFQILTKIPIILIVILNMISVFTGWIFSIDEYDHYTVGPLFYLQAIVSYVYLLLPTVHALRLAIKTRSRHSRREYLIYSAYMLPPLLAVLCLSMFMVLHMLCLLIQDMQIYNDALTGLNNRRRLDQFLEEHLEISSKDRPVSLLLMDVNGFKKINDKFGHIEGDAVLKMVGTVLKLTAVDFDAFAARYGGDEFCLVLHKAGCDPAEVKNQLNRRLEEAQESRMTGKYPVSISIGYVVQEAPEQDINRVIRLAYEQLYREKKKWHELNGK